MENEMKKGPKTFGEIMLIFYNLFFKTMANILFVESCIRKAHKIRLWYGDLRRFPVSTRAPKNFRSLSKALHEDL